MQRQRPTLLTQRQPGQSIVELALVLVFVLIPLVFGAMDAAQLIMTRLTLNEAVQQAAHKAALIGGYDGDGGMVDSGAKAVIDGGIITDANNAVISVTCSTTSCKRYSAITVSIEYTDDFWVRLGPFQQIHFTAQATRASEQDQTPAAPSGSPAPGAPGSGTPAPGGP